MVSVSVDPRVRVITVCRNDLKGLRSTIASVERQEFLPYEHLVQDGASTDGTLAWLSTLPSVPWRTVRSSADDGIYDAMNRAMDGDDYDLVVFLNSGDRFADVDVLRRIARSWRDQGWAWAYGQARLVREDGALVRLHELKRFPWIRFITGVRSVPHQAVVLTKEIVEAVGHHRLDVGLSADQEYLLRCWLRSPPARLPFVVADCDAGGVSAQQQPGAFARQMKLHRRALGRLVLGSRFTDTLATAAAVGWDTAKRRFGAPVRALRA